MHNKGRLEQARALCESIVAAESHHADALHLLGVITAQTGNFASGADLLAKAIALHPDNPDFHADQGLILVQLSRFEEALASYDRALTLQPGNSKVHANRGGTLYDLDRFAEALSSYEAALALNPDCIGAKEQCLSLCLMQANDTARIMQLATEISEHHAAEDAEKTRRFKAIPDYRVLHDFEQTAYLLQTDQDIPGLREAHAGLGGALSRQRVGLAGDLIALTEVEAGVIARFREQVIRDPAPAFAGPSLNPDNDWAAIEDQYFTGGPERVVIDNILSEQALKDLQHFSMASTIWRLEYPNRYLGAFPRGGFVSPLHLQIANELRQKMPRIFGEHALEQMWGFKYTSAQTAKGINVHADFARVNLNFWITPDDANLDPQSGGMIVYDTPAPASWSFEEYNSDPARVYAFLKDRNARAETVPYKCNRAVLFNSNLFHETDIIRFKEGYENRRINVTYLFGRGLGV